MYRCGSTAWTASTCSAVGGAISAFASRGSRIATLVAERGFRHIGQPELLGALRGAKSKPLGDAWCWSRKASPGDVAAVVALTLALAVGSEIPTDAGEITIY